MVCKVCPAIRTRIIHWYHDGMYSLAPPPRSHGTLLFHNAICLTLIVLFSADKHATCNVLRQTGSQTADYLQVRTQNKELRDVHNSEFRF